MSVTAEETFEPNCWVKSELKCSIEISVTARETFEPKLLGKI